MKRHLSSDSTQPLHEPPHELKSNDQRTYVSENPARLRLLGVSSADWDLLDG